MTEVYQNEIVTAIGPVERFQNTWDNFDLERSNCDNLSTPQSFSPTTNPFLLEWYVQLLYTCLFAILILVSAADNACVIWVVLSFRSMRTVTNYFIVNLSIADFCMFIIILFEFVYI